MNGFFTVPTKDGLQQNRAEGECLIRLLIEAIASSTLEQRIHRANDFRRVIGLTENVNAPTSLVRQIGMLLIFLLSGAEVLA
jgi:hypothetical protein